MTGCSPSMPWLTALYGPDSEEMARQSGRWAGLVEEYARSFGGGNVRLFSAPGRMEIGGNHTDHNHGKVLAAAVHLDTIAAAAATGDGRITVRSRGYPEPFHMALDNLAPRPEERGTTVALIRGIAARFRELGFSVGGLNACLDGGIPVGSGLSSSASVEVLLGQVFNCLYNEACVPGVQIAAIGQYAENAYFGKPCGLMDQIACALGGIVKIDFLDPRSPDVQNVFFDFGAHGYRILVVDTGGSHADLTEEYAAIPREMKQIAGHFGRAVCREITLKDVYDALPELRRRAGDRAVLRALHFLQENERVDLQVSALQKSDLDGFLRLVAESGNSSFRWLQNCQRPGSAAEQGVALGLVLSEGFVRRSGGACRVHGGGFAGTILVFLPAEETAAFQSLMESVFGPGCLKDLRIRPQGTVEIAGTVPPPEHASG